ncbi:MAG: 30S ribosomal protein S18 [Oligoflexia bacterium]|nr:30S ribosomal protein S18 [Oligoflexia bacterium]
MVRKNKRCILDKKKNLVFDYKDPLALYSFIEGAKIIPARNNGLIAKQQKQLRSAVKKARNLGLLPTHFQSYDDFGRPEAVSPKPFNYK